MSARNRRESTGVPLLMKTIAFSLAALPLTLGLAAPASAQLFHHHPKTATTHHHFLHRAAAGVGAYEIAKHTGSRRAAAGGHRNFLQRHPVLTGAAAYKLSKHRLHR